MTVHLLKLAVGATSIDSLRAWAQRSAAANASAGGLHGARITTRTAPRRAAEIVGDGSLYWVIKGSLQARQRVLSIAPLEVKSGPPRVAIHLDPEVVAVRPRPCRPFQGWRYLGAADAPADLVFSLADEAIPPTMRRELLELCLI